MQRGNKCICLTVVVLQLWSPVLCCIRCDLCCCGASAKTQVCSKFCPRQRVHTAQKMSVIFFNCGSQLTVSVVSWLWILKMLVLENSTFSLCLKFPIANRTKVTHRWSYCARNTQNDEYFFNHCWRVSKDSRMVINTFPSCKEDTLHSAALIKPCVKKWHMAICRKCTRILMTLVWKYCNMDDIQALTDNANRWTTSVHMQSLYNRATL